MNRLEQFKKRQREDAAKVQAELGGVIVNRKSEADNFGGDMHADIGDAEDADDEADEDDYVEEYDPEMSPAPVDLRTMQLEERRLPIVDEEDELRALVGAVPMASASSLFQSSSLPVMPSPNPPSSPSTKSALPPQPPRASPDPPQPTSKPSESIAKRRTARQRSSARTSPRKSSAIWTKDRPYLGHTTGVIGTGRGSRGSSIVCIRVSSGASITRPTTSEFALGPHALHR